MAATKIRTRGGAARKAKGLVKFKAKPKAKATRARDPKRTSASILAASVREFTEKGFGGARINEIARRADTNKRMLYHYFGDKEALYLAVLESAYVGIRSAERNSICAIAIQWMRSASWLCSPGGIISPTRSF